MKISSIMLTLVFIFCVALEEGIANEKSVKLPQVVTVSAGSMGTSSHTAAVLVAEVVSKYSGMRLVVEPTPSVGEGLSYLKNGRVEIVATANPMVPAMYQGTKWYKGNGFPELRMVANNYKSGYVYGVLETSNIYGVKDFGGKRIYSHPTHSPHMHFITEALTEMHKVTPAVMLPFGSADRAFSDLIEGKVDVIFWADSPGWRTVDRSPKGLRLFSGGKGSITQEELDYINKKARASVYRMQKREPGYLGLKAFAKSMTLVGSTTCWITSKKVPDEVIYRIVKAVQEHHDEYSKSYKKAAEFGTSEDVSIISAPFHSGAIRYYREIGLWGHDQDVIQEAQLKITGQN